MANVHGFRDMNNSNQNQNRPQPQYNYMGAGGAGNNANQQPQYDDENINIPFLSRSDGSGNPRQENFLQMIKYACCPTISWKSFIVWISVIDVIYFWISLILTWASKQGMDNNSEFLQPNLNVLNALGMRNTYEMSKGQVWRFLTPLILHANLLHIFSNVCIQLIMVQLETSIGTKRTIGLYFISGIGGILFSSLINDHLSVGASTAIMGLVAGYLGYVMLNWDALARFGFLRCMILFQIIFMILITFMVGIGFASNVDNYGHLGGLLLGFFGSIMLIKPILNRNYEKNLRIIASFIVVAFFLIGFICFYTTRNPGYIYIDPIHF